MFTSLKKVLKMYITRRKLRRSYGKEEGQRSPRKPRVANSWIFQQTCFSELYLSNASIILNHEKYLSLTILFSKDEGWNVDLLQTRLMSSRQKARSFYSSSDHIFQNLKWQLFPVVTKCRLKNLTCAAEGSNLTQTNSVGNKTLQNSPINS